MFTRDYSSFSTLRPQ